ncbi:hypothetical protein HK104_010357 [Borealophlyctis nickersoniae]|nr:hypothetical protein HK104_010357 [Borealophlyctis nickersoniae]
MSDDGDAERARKVEAARRKLKKFQTTRAQRESNDAAEDCVSSLPPTPPTLPASAPLARQPVLDLPPTASVAASAAAPVTEGGISNAQSPSLAPQSPVPDSSEVRTASADEVVGANNEGGAETLPGEKGDGEREFGEHMQILRSEVAVLRESLEEREGEVSLLSQSNAQLRLALARRQSASGETAESLQQKCNDLLSQLEHYRLQAVHLAEQHKTREEKISSETERLRATVAELEHAARTAEAKIAVLESGGGRNQQEGDQELASRVQHLEGGLEKLRLQLEDANATIEVLQKSNAAQAEEAEVARQQATREIQQLKEEKGGLQEEFGRLAEEFARARHNDELQAALLRMEADKEDAENRCRGMVKTTDALNARLLRAETEKETVEARLGALMVEFQNFRKGLNQTADGTRELQEKISALEAENRILEEARNMAVEEYSTKLKEALRDHETLGKEKDRLVADLTLARTRSSELEEQVISGQSSDGPSSTVLPASGTPDVSDLQDQLSKAIAAQAKLAEENTILRSELDRCRLSQADVGSVLLNNRDPASSDVIRVLQRRCDELAAEVQTHREAADEMRSKADQAKQAQHDRDVEREKARHLEKEVEALAERSEREQANWKAREQTLYAEMDKVRKESDKVLRNVEALRRFISDCGGDASADFLSWAKWAVAEQQRLKAEVEEAHITIDLQHEKLNQALTGSGQSVPAAIGGDEKGAGLPVAKGPSLEAETQTDPMLAFARISTIKANLVSGRVHGSMRSSSSRRSSVATRSRRGSVGSVASSPAGAGHFTTSVAPSPAGHETFPPSVGVSPAGPGLFPPSVSALPSPAVDAEGASERFPLEMENAQLRSQLAKLTSRFAELQQSSTATAEHLDHQMRVNSEMKKLIVGASIGGGNTGGSGWGSKGKSAPVDGNLLEKYGEAMNEIGTLREELDRWRRRCEEVEEVVEQVILQQAEEDATEEEDFQDHNVERFERSGVPVGRPTSVVVSDPAAAESVALVDRRQTFGVPRIKTDLPPSTPVVTDVSSVATGTTPAVDTEPVVDGMADLDHDHHHSHSHDHDHDHDGHHHHHHRHHHHHQIQQPPPPPRQQNNDGRLIPDLTTTTHRRPSYYDTDGSLVFHPHTLPPRPSQDGTLRGGPADLTGACAECEGSPLIVL